MTFGPPATESHDAGWAWVGGGGDAVSVALHEREGVTVIAISGEVDISNIDRVSAAIFALPNTAAGLVVDLTAVTYLDSSAVSLIHDLAIRLRRRSQRLVVVCNPQSAPHRVLELTALDSNAPILDSLDPAIRMINDEL